MNKKTMQFELDKKSLKMKDILDKEFVEIEVYAISDAYPNRNNSVFPLESMKAALPSFANKPILGAWDNKQEDFKSHNCDLQYDADLESMYYDYTRPGCETPLGMIRESDKVEIVFDEERNENWIVVHAVLWSRYAYNQIKKLLRKNGRSKISVEIEVEESHTDENNYEILDRFNFTGLTILGTENGKAVEEGIENAHLNILELMNNSLFQQKQKALAFAYSALDDYNKKQNVETPIEGDALSEQDSNIQFNKENNPNANEEQPQVAMEQNDEKEEGGKAMPDEVKQEALETEAKTCEEAQTEEPEKETQACGDKESEACDEKFDHDGDDKPKCIQCTIHDLMIDEHEAIEGYRHAIAHFSEEFPDIVKVFEDIMHEELEHLGELEQCLAALDPEVEEEIAEGKVEAMETIIEANYGEGEGNPAEQEFAEDDKDTSEDEDPEQKPKEEEPEDEPENVEAPKDNKGDDANDFAEEPKDEDDDEDDDDEDDDEDDDDDKDEDDEPDDEEGKEDEFGCGKESDFSNTLDPNAEPINVDVDGMTMGEIVEESTQSIKAPAVVTEVEHMGEANKEVASVLPDVQQEVVNGDPDGTANEDGSPINPVVGIIQPEDTAKEQDKHFVSEAEVGNVDVAELLKKYNELEEKFNKLNDAAKNQEAERLLQFGTNFINADEVVDEENKKNFISQLEEKCKAFEFETEEDVTKFAKGLMAMYYYEHQATKKDTKANDFSVNINRPAHNANNASTKLKDAINKLNYLNKEE